MLTPDEAREDGQAILAEVAKGKDPAADKSAKRREHTVASLIDLYEAEGCCVLRGTRIGQPMKERNKKYTIDGLRHHVVPLIGNRRVSEIDAADIEQLVRDMEPLRPGRIGLVSGLCPTWRDPLRVRSGLVPTPGRECPTRGQASGDSSAP